MIRLLPLLLLVACAQQYNNKQSIRFIDDGLIDIVTEFETTFNVRVEYEVVWVDSIPQENVIGTCYRSGSYRKVSLLRSYQHSIYFNQLLYHELGHCSLILDHYNETIDIMNSHVSDEVALSWDFYVEQMIDRVMNPIQGVSDTDPTHTRGEVLHGLQVH